MIAKSNLDSIKLRITHSQIRIGEVPPFDTHIHGLSSFPKNLDATPASCSEVKIRSVASRQVGVRDDCATREFDIRPEASYLMTRIPAHDDWVEATTVNPLGP